MAKRLADPVDERLISLLTQNARLPTAALARQLGLSRSAVQERLKRLERDGVITGYRVVLAAAAPAAPFAAHVMMRLEPKLHDRAIEALRGMPEVKSCRTVSGEWDLVAEVEAPSGTLLDDVLTRIGKLPGIARTMSSIILTTKFDRR
jgi:DNA-binding Lrp family transcriptional regulator